MIKVGRRHAAHYINIARGAKRENAAASDSRVRLMAKSEYCQLERNCVCVCARCGNARRDPTQKTTNTKNHIE